MPTRMRWRFVAVFAATGAIAVLAVLTAIPFLHNRGVEIVFNESPEIGDEVVVHFPTGVSEQNAKSAFRIQPTVNGQLVWLAEFRELHFVPATGFDPDRSYRVTVRLRHPLVAAATISQKTYTVQTSTAMQEAYYPPTVTEGRYIDINLETMKLTLVESGKVQDVFPVAGKGNPWRTPTRQGTFTIKSKENRHWSSIYKLWMPLSMNYSGDYYVHGMPYWPNGARLTSVYSGGCIRLFDHVARAVYDWADIGTTIVVHATPHASLVAPSLLENGDIAREIGDSRVFIIKQAGGRAFKRHVLTAEFEQWYPHLQPFRIKTKLVPQGTLAAYLESRWVKLAQPGFPIYEISADGVKHLVLCGGASNCSAAWTAYGWDPDEIYSVNEQELAYYPQGNDVELRSAP